MAKTWIVTPNDGVTAVTNGVYIFPANDSYDDKVYTVTLKDTDCNCVAHKTVRVKGKTRPGCSCSITSDYGTTSSKISGDQHTNVKVGTFSSYFCTGTTSFSYGSGDADFLSNFAYVGNDIYADVSSNDSYTNSRMAIYNASCGGSLTIYQDKREEPVPDCPTSMSGIIQVGSNLGAAGGSGIPINVWVKENETYTSHTVTSTDTSIISNITDGQLYPGGGREIKANVASNESSDFRRYVDITVTVFGPTLPSSGCPFTITLTQEGSCATIEQSFYLGRMNNNKISGDSQTSVGIAYVNPTSPYASWTAAFSTGTGNFVRNLTITNKPGGPGASKKVTVDIDENNTGADRPFDVVFTGTKTDGGTCFKTLKFTQAPYSSPSVCNCDDLVVNGTSTYATVTFINSSSNFASVTVGNVKFFIFDESSVSHPFTVNFGNISLSPGESKSLNVDIDGAQGYVEGVTAVLDGVSEVFVKAKTQRTDRWITDNTNNDGTLEYGNTITLTHFEPNS